MRPKGPSIAPDAPAVSPASVDAGLMRPKGPVDAADAPPAVAPIVSGQMRTKGGADAGDALAGALAPPAVAGGIRPKGAAAGIYTPTPSDMDNLEEAAVPAGDDFSVIEGDTYGQRKVHLGTVVTRDVPLVGDAGAAQVVLGNDTRLGGVGAGAPATTLAELDDVQIPAPASQEILTFNFSLSKWVSWSILDGGNF